MATTIKIGHAGSSSTGVYINNNYDPTVSLNPYVVLRPKNKAVAIRSAQACELACANDNIVYSQERRNTLKGHIEKVAGSLSDQRALNAISYAPSCAVDCASFVTVCACVGGATFGYGWQGSYNAPVTSNMVNWFTSVDDYIALTDPRYTTCTDYLKRGDILVKETQHTVMVLENGCKVLDDIKLSATIDNIKSTYAEASIKLFLLQDGKEVPVDESPENAGIFNAYKWSYAIKQLETSAKEITKEITINSAITKVKITGLEPNTSYYLHAEAAIKKDKDSIDNSIKFISPNLVFTTLQDYPLPVENLKATLDKTDDNKFIVSLSFMAPKYWPIGYSSAGYRTSIIVNGIIIANDDTIIKKTGNQVSISILLDKFADKINFGDVLQIGINPWTKDKKQNIIINSSSLRCSGAMYIDYPMTIIDKAYLKLNDNFKRVIIDSSKHVIQ